MTLEKLLNTLCEKGWKPFGYKGMKATVNIYWEIRFEREWHFFIETFRTLTSKESWLWQFVCENGMSEKHTDIRVRCNEKTSKTYQDSYVHQHYEYRLIESALCDEDKLEQFLLDNIKIDET